MEHTSKRIFFMAFSAAALVLTAQAVDNAHFYKPPTMYGSMPTCWFSRNHNRTTITRDWLTKVDVSFMAGSTSRGWDKNGTSANILNSTGSANMLALLENVVHDPLVGLNAIATDPELLRGYGMSTFGRMTFSGKFSMSEFDFAYRQNVTKGFFVECMLPVRTLKLDDIARTDLTPATGNGGFNQTKAEWVRLKNNLDQLIAFYGLDQFTEKFSKTGVGDLSLLVGYQLVHDPDDDRWYSAIIKAGLVLPTGQERMEKRIFSLPMGNDKNLGLHGGGQLLVGMSPWLALGMHLDVTYFLKGSEKTFYMKTAYAQNGFLKLGHGDAALKNGTLWHVGFDLTFDHVFAGISPRIGYSFTQQEDATLNPANTALFSKATANSDSTVQAWNQHVCHFLVDWDCSNFIKNRRWAPRISGFYNLPVSGKNVYKTQLFGGSLGVDIRWKM